jgi:hypothetical protein
MYSWLGKPWATPATTSYSSNTDKMARFSPIDLFYFPITFLFVLCFNTPRFQMRNFRRLMNARCNAETKTLQHLPVSKINEYHYGSAVSSRYLSFSSCNDLPSSQQTGCSSPTSVATTHPAHQQQRSSTLYKVSTYQACLISLDVVWYGILGFRTTVSVSEVFALPSRQQ